MNNTVPFASESSSNIERKRKQRIVKNADVDIDNVLESPGPNDSTWKHIAKQKLKERETKIMKRRMNVVQKCINEEIQTFENCIIKKHTPNISLTSSIYSNIMHKNYELFSKSMNKLIQLIDTWRGPTETHMSRKLSTFREYFLVAKSWYDQRKKEILATELWTTIFKLILKMINQLSQCFAETILLQKELQRAISSKVFLRIFQEKWTFPASKPLQLIPISFVKKSKHFKKFLMENILCIDERQFGNANVSAIQLSKHIMQQLTKMSIESAKQFELNLITLSSYSQIYCTSSAVSSPAMSLDATDNKYDENESKYNNNNNNNNNNSNNSNNNNNGGNNSNNNNSNNSNNNNSNN
eukprot:288672_1